MRKFFGLIGWMTVTTMYVVLTSMVITGIVALSYSACQFVWITITNLFR